MYLNNLDTVKRTIEEDNSDTVIINVLRNSENNYNTEIDVSFEDTCSGTVFKLGLNETYDDAVNRANNLYKELRYAKAILKVKK